MGISLCDPLPDPEWRGRPIAGSDREGLAILLYASFRGTIDDESETYEDARREIDAVFAGGSGVFLPDASFAVEAGEVLASACLVTWFAPHAAPLVVFSMTRPEHRRRGMARALLLQSAHALRARGERRLTLIVTVGNAPAERLYASLGFSPLDPFLVPGSAPV